MAPNEIEDYRYTYWDTLRRARLSCDGVYGV